MPSRKLDITKTKKADLTWNTIILIILGIIVLVILIMIFTGNFRGFSNWFNSTNTDQKKAGEGQFWCLTTAGINCFYAEENKEMAANLGGECDSCEAWKNKGDDNCPGSRRYYIEGDAKPCCCRPK